MLKYNKQLTYEKKMQYYNETIKVAENYREKIIGKNEPITETFKLIEKLGFTLIRFPSKTDSLSGFHIKKGDMNFIYINTNHTLGRQFFSVWHEVYHAEIEGCQSITYLDQISNNESECKAECFAGIILMPENLVRSFIEKKDLRVENIGYEDIIRLQNYFRVSYTAIVKRLTQIYPENRETLNKLYDISKDTSENRRRLEEKTKIVKGDLNLIKPTSEVYIPYFFIKDISENLKNKRISKEKADYLIKLIERVENSNGR